MPETNNNKLLISAAITTFGIRFRYDQAMELSLNVHNIEWSLYLHYIFLRFPRLENTIYFTSHII